MSKKNPNVNFIFLSQRWGEEKLSWKEEIPYALAKAMEILEQDLSDQELSIVFADDKTLQELNKTYRQKDKPTNVLSFPSEEEGELGDIILAYETIIKESAENGISPLHHTLHLIIHGFLHLLGYDHQEETETEHMEKTEILILNHLNISNPYEDS